MKEILVLDGAMGTLISDKFKISEKCKEKVNIIFPEIITKIHENYIEAGADLIKANTFNCSKEALTKYGEDPEKSYDYALNGARLAKRCALKYGKKSVGTFCLGDESQINGILDGDVDLILIETIFDYEQGKKSLDLLRQIMKKREIKKPIMISFAVNKLGQIYSGEKLVDIFSEFIGEDIFSIGINCSEFSKEILEVFKSIKNKTTIKLSYHPNSDGNIENYLSIISECLENGVLDIVGGCCGTNEEHIKRLKNMIEKSGVPEEN
ncbi:homocysteine S-methyltransferase family protein [Cetobacterium sp. 8H]|uniref:homocysteine S-methyltransferase family protein n=1 Tax=Cetobacterium sp. 8H TaxID=2759681 RepID=UPI00163C7C47|nr:homocysteine S-methyltransferase family protein [Cetobacterium sp. 8H]MBC2850369.1 homocysteine S-methyltransferase family protein [Cetobacterium sp. 8H]